MAVYLLAMIITVLAVIAFFMFVTRLPKGYGGWVFLYILYVISIAANTASYLLMIRRAADEGPKVSA